MEQHPVPQNVTTFQFRLIGDMTIKQFGYLAGGAILAYVSYKLPLPFFFRWPLTFIFALGGVGFAFVPVEERPMDIWVMSFIKNIYSPTQFVWSHEAAPEKSVAFPAGHPHPAVPAPPAHVQAVKPPAVKPVTDVLQRIFTPVPVHQTADGAGQAPRATPTLVHPVAGPFDWIIKLFSPPPRTVHPAAFGLTTAAIPTPSVTGRHLDVSSPPKVTSADSRLPAPEAKVQQKEEELATRAREIAGALEEKTQTHARILELQKQLTDVLSERDRMRDEMAALRTKTPQPVTPIPPASPGTTRNASYASTVATPAVPRPRTPTVNIITAEGAVKAGLPRLTTFPNVVTGIARDSDNNLLPGVLVTVRDKEGVPLRALKTNRLGQFAASTPIANGTYLVEIEDPRGRYTFDRAQVTLNGSIVPALEIIAKSQKEVAREKLAKQIFGT